jgi:hypothetical protein
MPSIWSLIEVCVAIICACLPAIRGLLSYWFPALFDITTKAASKIQLSNSIHLESQSNRTGRRTREATVAGDDDDDDDEMIIQRPDSTYSRGQDLKIIRTRAFDEIPQSTSLKTPGDVSDYAPSESRLSIGQDSDEVEFLEAKTAIPLRNRDAAQTAANKSWPLR